MVARATIVLLTLVLTADASAVVTAAVSDATTIGAVAVELFVTAVTEKEEVGVEERTSSLRQFQLQPQTQPQTDAARLAAAAAIAAARKAAPPPPPPQLLQPQIQFKRPQKQEHVQNSYANNTNNLEVIQQQQQYDDARHWNDLSSEQFEDLVELLARFYAHIEQVNDQVEEYFSNLILTTSSQSSSVTEPTKVAVSPTTLNNVRSNNNMTAMESSVAAVATATNEQLANVLKFIQKKFGADEVGLREWLANEQGKFVSLRKRKIELLSDSPLNYSTATASKYSTAARAATTTSLINVCADGPKILIAPNISSISYCYPAEQWLAKLWSDLNVFSVLNAPIIVLSVLIFLIGTTGNIFVCLSVYRNHQLRNVTNYFIVNLAFADFLVILICLPPTVIWDLSLTWFFGTVPCKLIMFLQDVSISVSVLTLTAISIDRYYAICYPLKFKTNLRQAEKIIATIWLLSFLIMTPDLIYLSAHESRELTDAGLSTVLYSDCNYNWSQQASSVFQFVKTILLYLLPFILMFAAHLKILKTLRVAPMIVSSNSTNKNIHIATDDTHATQLNHFYDQNHNQNNDESKSQSKNSHCQATDSTKLTGRQLNEEERQEGTNLKLDCTLNPNLYFKQTTRNENNQNDTAVAVQSSQSSSFERKQQKKQHQQRERLLRVRSSIFIGTNNSTRLESRRNATKMLMCITCLFGICYLPVHLVNFLRQFIDNIPQTDATLYISMLSHCICYLNSAINPIIYNHMNTIFRAEFKKFLSCFCAHPSQHLQLQRSASNKLEQKQLHHHHHFYNNNTHQTLRETTA